MAAKRDIVTQLFQGEAVTLSWGATDVDLTGATVLLRIGKVGNEALIAKTCTITSAATGEFEAAITAAELSLAPGRYWYETRRSSAPVRTLFYGELVLQDSLFVLP